MGRANEGIARKQEVYLQTATATWLEGLERSLAQMKEYQVISTGDDMPQQMADLSL